MIWWIPNEYEIYHSIKDNEVVYEKVFKMKKKNVAYLKYEWQFFSLKYEMLERSTNYAI